MSPVLHKPLTWVKRTGSLPKNVLVAGHDKNGVAFGVCRSMSREGKLISGKVRIDNAKACFAHNGKEVVIDQYEVLVADAGEDWLTWISASDGEVPTGAVVVTDNGSDENDFVARAILESNLVPGRVIKAEECCLVALDGKCFPVKKYEVLCVKAFSFPEDEPLVRKD